MVVRKEKYFTQDIGVVSGGAAAATLPNMAMKILANMAMTILANMANMVNMAMTNVAMTNVANIMARLKVMKKYQKMAKG